MLLVCLFFFFLGRRRHQKLNRPDTRFPYTTLFRCPLGAKPPARWLRCERSRLRGGWGASEAACAVVEVRAKPPARWLGCERSEPRNHPPQPSTLCFVR